MPTLFLIVLLDLVGFGMIIPILPFYAERLGIAPSAVIFLFGLYSLGQLMGAPVWGALSDRLGRRPILLATLAANVAANILLAHAANGWELGLSRFASGLAAGNISIAYAYVTDITSDADRPRALGMLGAAFGIGFIAGPALGGVLAGMGGDETNIALVAYAAAVLSAAALVATWRFLPESHGPEQRSAARGHNQATRWALVTRPVLRELLLATLLVIGAVSVLQASYAIWSAEVLGMSARRLGIFFAAVGLVSATIQGVLIGRLNRRFGSLALARAGGILNAVALAALPFAPTATISLAPLLLFGAAGALFMPSISSLVSNTAAPNERGAVLGVFQGASSLGRVLGPMMASVVAAYAGLRLPFFFGAAAALAGVWLIRNSGKWEPGTGKRENNSDSGLVIRDS